MNNDGSTLTVVIVITTVILFGAVFFVEREQAAEWAAFSAAHNCKVVEKIEGRTSFRSDGKTYSEPDRTVYLCDDGVRYTR